MCRRRRRTAWRRCEQITLKEQSKLWGGWWLEHRHLAYPAYTGGDYPIDVERFTSSAEVLDMIAQVSMKGWATPECLAGLVRAIDDLLHLQGRLCGCGTDKRLTPAEIRKMVPAKLRTPAWRGRRAEETK